MNETASNTTKSANTHHAGIDIERLAAKVYQLMREDVRLARARGETSRRQTKK